MKPTKLPSGSWRCLVYLGKDQNGKRIQKSVTSNDYYDCLEQASKLAKHHHQVSVNPSYMTLGEAIDDYIQLKSNILSPATIRGYKSIRDNHLKPEMGIQLTKLSDTVIQKAINRESKDFSPKTIRNIYGLLTKIFSQYAGRTISASLPQKTPYEAKVLTEDELKSLIKVIQGEEVEVPILLALFLGLRRSEILALTHDDYDPKTKTLTINKALVPNEKNQYVVKTTKTVKSNRKISVPPYLSERLEARIKVDLEFCTVSPSHICTKLKKICKANNLPEIRLHDLRHQNASVMLALGVADKYAMERGGWSSNATMKNIYQHTMSTKRSETDDLINDYFQSLV